MFFSEGTASDFASVYKASQAANARMMNTTIWQACKILGLDVNNTRPGEAFHKLYELFYQEELLKQ